MTQQELFDPAKSEQAKKAGMEKAADYKRSQLSQAQRIAIQIAQESPTRTCNADQVQSVILPLGINLGQAGGSIFKGGEWECVGFQKSSRISNHARIIRVWRLK